MATLVSMTSGTATDAVYVDATAVTVKVWGLAVNVNVFGGRSNSTEGNPFLLVNVCVIGGVPVTVTGATMVARYALQYADACARRVGRRVLAKARKHLSLTHAEPCSGT